jgi:hypothetical protein
MLYKTLVLMTLRARQRFVLIELKIHSSQLPMTKQMKILLLLMIQSKNDQKKSMVG